MSSGLIRALAFVVLFTVCAWSSFATEEPIADGTALIQRARQLSDVLNELPPANRCAPEEISAPRFPREAGPQCQQGRMLAS